jgi:hypothetical protein
MSKNSEVAKLSASLFGVVRGVTAHQEGVAKVLVQIGPPMPEVALYAMVPDGLLAGLDLAEGAFIATTGTMRNLPEGCEYHVETLAALSPAEYTARFTEEYGEEFVQ